MNYIGFFDDEGNRITSICEGLHYTEDDKNEVVEHYKSAYPNIKYVKELSESEYLLSAKANYVLKDGELTYKEPKPITHNDLEEYSEKATGIKPLTNAELTEMLYDLVINNNLVDESEDEE